ncbi:hypothetical protein [Arsenophonus endosymbiont of Bemisia tabaci]|uniref:hypothetical protein n=1 Tax=Arsenophonus endosymbiont of Bemisia tabaci TaxID=536059 RepID=UPI001EE37E96|nr:hypothetical protein [Arsenophonus endosymbiont of Bemisia tabaci]
MEKNIYFVIKIKSLSYSIGVPPIFLLLSSKLLPVKNKKEPHKATKENHKSVLV